MTHFCGRAVNSIVQPEQRRCVFPPCSRPACQWQGGSCGTGAARPGTERWGTPYKEDNPSAVGPAELSHGGLEPSPTVKSVSAAAEAPTNLRISTSSPLGLKSDPTSHTLSLSAATPGASGAVRFLQSCQDYPVSWL